MNYLGAEWLEAMRQEAHNWRWSIELANQGEPEKQARWAIGQKHRAIKVLGERAQEGVSRWKA